MLLNIFIFFTALLGFQFLGIRIWHKLNLTTGWNGLFSRPLEPDYSGIFVFIFTWFLAQGIMTLFTSLSFYLDFDFNQTRLLLSACGFSSILLNLKWLRKNLKFNFRELKFSVSKLEWLIIVAISYLAFLYFFRSIVPWFDQDEMTQYGYFGKSIAEGHTFTPLFKISFDGNTKFSETFYAQVITVFKSVAFLRFFKLFNLYCLALFVYVYLLRRGVGRIYALLGPLFLLGTPELGYLATSTKVDAVLLNFEFLSLIVFLTCLDAFIRNKETSSLILILSCLINYIAVATRMSAAYGGIFISLFTYWYLLSREKNKLIKCYGLLFLLVSALLYAHPYLKNYLEFKNILFPFDGPGPFKEGLFIFKSWEWRENCNLPLKWPFPFYHIFLLIYVALGLETTMYDFITFLPRTLGRGNSIGWLNPVMLSFLVAPIVLRKNIFILISTFFFWIIFIIWAANMQLTRSFFAPSSLSILVTLIWASTKINGKDTGFYLQKILRFSFIPLIFFFLLYHTIYIVKKYPHSFSVLWSELSRYESNLLIYKKYHEHQHAKSAEYHPLSFEDIKKLQSIFDQMERPLINIVGFRGEIFHIFFSKGIFQSAVIENNKVIHATHHMKIPNPNINYNHDLIIRIPPLRYDCYLIRDNAHRSLEEKEIQQKYYTYLKFTSQDLRYQLFCQKP